MANEVCNGGTEVGFVEVREDGYVVALSPSLDACTGFRLDLMGERPSLKGLEANFQLMPKDSQLNVAAILALGFLLGTGQQAVALETPDDPVSIDLDTIHQKAGAGHPYYQAYMGIIYRTGYKNVRIDYNKSLEWTKLAVEKKHPLGLANMGAIRLWEVEDAIDVPSQREKQRQAKQLYDDAFLYGLPRLAKYGDPLAADLLADYYFVSSPPSPELCEKFLRVGIEKGYPRCMCALGFFQMTGLGGIAVNKKEGIYHLEQAASQFLPEGLMNLATAYLKGDGVPESKEKALILYNEAARRGHQPASSALEKIANFKPKVKPVAQKPAPVAPAAETVADKSAKTGEVPPPARPAPTPSAPTPAADPGLRNETSGWLERAASGDIMAQRHLGLMYWVGKDGLPKDLGKAKEWLGKAAAQGDNLAQKRLDLLVKLYNLD